MKMPKIHALPHSRTSVKEMIHIGFPFYINSYLITFVAWGISAPYSGYSLIGVLKINLDIMILFLLNNSCENIKS